MLHIDAMTAVGRAFSLLLLLLLAAPAATQRLSVTTSESGAFAVFVDGAPWLSSAPSSLFASGAERPVLLGNRTTTYGTDALGAWEAQTWSGAAGGTRVQAAVRLYAGRGAVTFDVMLPDGAQGTQRAAPNTTEWLAYGDAAPIIDFPSFAWGGEGDLGFMTTGGDQIADAAWSWRSEGGLPPSAGRGSGPFVVYIDPRAAAVAICPLTNFAAAVSFFNTSAPDAWRWGPSGKLTSLPPGFVHRTLVVLGPGGFSSAWEEMGAALQQLNASASGARGAVQDADPNLRVLSYYTDAGTMYTSGAPSAELVRVIKEAASEVPLGLVQLDDWAHQSTCSINCNGLSRWAGDPQWFGDAGWRGFSDSVGLPLALYLPGAGLCPGAGREFYNVSTLQGDGGLFETPAPADAPSFFQQIMAGGLAQGMGSTLEIDFLDAGFLMVREFREQLDAYPAYFSALGRAAEAAGVAVELCMALPLHVLSAAAHSHITSMRVGEDFDWPTNCDISVTSFLPWSVGLAPSKDSFMSSNRSNTSSSWGPPFVQGGVSNMGALPELNAVIAAFSTGPVGLGDGLGATDASVVLPACDAGGRLLQPDRPLLAVDATFSRVGQDPRGAPDGHCKSSWMSRADGGAVWSSLTRLVGQTTHFVLAINVSRPFVLQRSDPWPRLNESSVFVSRQWGRTQPCTNGSLAVASGCVLRASPAEALPDLRSRSAAANGTYALGESPFVLLAVHEVPASGWVLWEEEKYVALSRARFLAVGASGSGLRAALRGAPGEVVKLVALRPQAAAAAAAAAADAAGPSEWTVVTAQATLDSTGQGEVVFQ